MAPPWQVVPWVAPPWEVVPWVAPPWVVVVVVLVYEVSEPVQVMVLVVVA